MGTLSVNTGQRQKLIFRPWLNFVGDAAPETLGRFNSPEMAFAAIIKSHRWTVRLIENFCSPQLDMETDRGVILFSTFSRRVLRSGLSLDKKYFLGRQIVFESDEAEGFSNA